MKIAVVGTGYVGLVSGACLAEFGHNVTCIDVDADKIGNLEKGIMPIYEPGLETLVGSNITSGRLTFTTDMAASVPQSDVVLIAVGTPSRRGDGFADLSYVYAAASEIAALVEGYTVVATKSTVPVGTCDHVQDIISPVVEKRDGDIRFDVASNPEFLRESSAIEDFMRPDRVVVGANNKMAHEVMAEMYRPLSLQKVPMIQTTPQTAELTKYAGNAFLATKITFINQIADLCEKVGADVQEVARGIGLDNRIGGKFLHAGPGFGGSCFPKDIRALQGIAEQAGGSISLVDAVVDANEARKKSMASRVVALCSGSVDGKTIAVLGLTYKPNTDDMRESPSIDLIQSLQTDGAIVRAYDPKGMEEARELLPGVTFCADEYAAMEGADAVVIVTEWNQFRALDLDRVRAALVAPVVVDLRNIYNPEEMKAAGFTYSSIGRGSIA